MAAILWDQIGSRTYESGVDHCVLYPIDGTGIPWNGIVSVSERSNSSESSVVYFDGVKIAGIINTGDFSGSIKAITYPDEFLEFEGLKDLGNGLFASGQDLPKFNLTYRTKIGNDTSDVIGYKIHILYNLTALPVQKTYQTLSDGNTPIEFEWTITSVPVLFGNNRPTSHLVLDSRMVDPILMEDIENTLYGNEINDPRLPSIETLSSFIGDWVIIRVTDNFDGTFTIEGPDDMITMLDPTTFQIINANAMYLDEFTYDISSTTY